LVIDNIFFNQERIEKLRYDEFFEASKNYYEYPNPVIQ